MIKIELTAGFGPSGALDAGAAPAEPEVADLAELIFEAARERLDVPPGEAFGLDDIERAGLLGGEPAGPAGEPPSPGSERAEASRMRDILGAFFSSGSQ